MSSEFVHDIGEIIWTKVTKMDCFKAFMKCEKNSPGFIENWEKMKNKINASNIFDKKDGDFVFYCTAFSYYMQRLNGDDRFFNMIYIAIFLQTKIRYAYKIFESSECEILTAANNNSEFRIVNMIEDIIESHNRYMNGKADRYILDIHSEVAKNKLSNLLVQVKTEENTVVSQLENIEELLTDYSFKKIQDILLHIYLPYQEIVKIFQQNYNELLEEERRSINTAQESLRLGKENFIDGFSDSDAFVFFKNGTCVLVYCQNLKDEQAVINSAKEELLSAKDIHIDFIESDDVNDVVKGHICIATNFSFRTVWNICWHSWHSNDIDQAIVTELRRTDIEQLEIDSILYGG